MNACVERQATTARFPRASSSPIAFSRCVLPRPLFPTSTSGLYFFPGRSRAARAALTATWFEAPTAKAASGNAADGPGGGAPPSRTLAAASSASLSRSGSRNTLCPAACGSSSATSASSALRRSTSSPNAVIAWSTAPGASRCSNASRRWVRYPSPSHLNTASPTRARHASTAFPTVTATSARNSPNSSPPPLFAAAARPSPGGRAVDRQHDLPPRRLQRLREAQQLGLHFLAVREELHVVLEQHVHVLKPAAERVALPRRDARMERLDVLVERQIFDVQLGRGLFRGVADRHQEMRLAEAGGAVNKEGVVRRARALGHRVTRGDGEPVRRAHHEGVEGVLGVERAGHAAVPAASFLSTSSEIPLSVSNTPLPWSASALKLGTPRKFRASSKSAGERISSRGKSCLLYCSTRGMVRMSTPCSSKLLCRFCRLSRSSSS